MIQALYPERWFMPMEPGFVPIAEGITVKSPGHLTRQILSHHLADLLAVNDEKIEEAMNDLLVKNRLVVEGAGAAGVAALLAHRELFMGKHVGIVICGGNVDARIISALVLRGLIHHGKLARLKVQIYDAPGVLSQLTGIIGSLGGNIFEISHQRLFNHITVKMAEVDVVLEARGQEHVREIVLALNQGGFPTKVIE